MALHGSVSKHSGKTAVRNPADTVSCYPLSVFVDRPMPRGALEPTRPSPARGSLRAPLALSIAATIVVSCGASCRSSVAPPRPHRPPTPQAATAPPAPPASPVNPANTLTAPDPVPESHRTRVAALALDARGAIDAFANRDGQWSPDRRKLLLLSNRRGPWQAYESHWRDLHQPPARIAALPPPIEAATFTRDGHALVSLGGADARLQIFDLASGSVHDIEGVVGEPSLPLVPTRSRSSLVTLSRQADASVIYQVTLATGGTARAVANEDADSRIADISPGGERLLVVRPSRDPANSLVELDLRTGAPRSVLPAGFALQVIDAAYAADTDALIIAARAADGADHVQRIGTKTPKHRVTTVYEVPPPKRLIRLLASPRGIATALEIDAGDRTEIRIAYPGGYRKDRALDLPQGTGRLGRFSLDGKVLTFTWETPSQPPDLFEVEATRGTVRALRQDARAALATLDPLVARDAAVREGELALRVHVFLPAAVAAGPRAACRVVVLADDEARRRHAWRPVVRFLVGHGYAVLEPSGSVAKEAWAELGRWAGEQPWGTGAPRALVGLRSGRDTVLEVAETGLQGWDAIGTLIGWEPSSRAPSQNTRNTPSESASSRWFVGQAGLDPHEPREASDAFVRGLRDRHIPTHYAVDASPTDASAAQAMLLARLTWFLDGSGDSAP